LSERESEHVRAVRQSRSEVGKWICQSCVSEQISGESEHVRVGVGASMSELLEWACQSCGSELVGVMRVKVYACQSVRLSDCMLVRVYACQSSK